MSIKLKIVLGLLVVTAGFMVFRLGLFFKKSVNYANLSSQTQKVLPAETENPLLKDSDKDGIPDLEEPYYGTDPFNPDTDGDGFLDGEEVASGFDPTKKGNDKIAAIPDNITNTLADRVLAGVYAGDLKLKSKEFKKSVNLVTFAALDETNQLLSPPDYDQALIISDNSKKSQEKYLTAIAGLLDGPFLDEFMNQTQTMARAAQALASGNNKKAYSIFNKLSLTYTNAYTKLLTVPVPPDWKDFHKHLLSLFNKLSKDYKALTKIYDDPILAMAALNNLANNLFEVESSLVQELKTLIRKEGINPPNSPLFETMGILGK